MVLHDTDTDVDEKDFSENEVHFVKETPEISKENMHYTPNETE